MAIIPLKQTVKIVRKGEPDRWGNAPVEEFTLKCRFVEGTKLTRRTSAQNGSAAITSEEVVSAAQIFLDKFADVKVTDEFHYTDEAGNERLYLPISIERKVWLNGKTKLTVVNV
ncbi:hypothetical protein [Heyndrickxia oleronia]|uniref:Phage protein n=1 Tax=Heyndrickxia oleronia TaxID=38875 RepID=A0AAW6SS80_9BACI|nr:hypothetical protein [Heyndrickxia oleronia]MDH5159824.1 hypothetical protein [Heyndrickxia oleronia]